MSGGYYVYAILGPEPRSRAGRVPAGFGGEPVESLGSGDVRAAVSRLAGPPPAPTRAHVLWHEAIVEDLARREPILPVRFGTALADAPAVLRALETRRDVLRSDLERLGGTVEFGLLVLAGAEASAGCSAADQPADQTSPVREALMGSGPGAAYLRTRLAWHRREANEAEEARHLVEELDGALGAYALESRHTVHPGGRLLLRAAYRVHPVAVTAFRAAFRAARHTTFQDPRGAHQGRRFLLTGPWPPYSFVSPSATPTTPAGATPEFGALRQLLGN